jgi:hypothetical protein
MELPMTEKYVTTDDQLRAALAANPAPAGLTSTDQLEAEQRGQPIPFANPAPAGLDVERLAMAMNKVSGILANDWAVRVAAEYARLGSAAEEEG